MTDGLQQDLPPAPPPAPAPAPAVPPWQARLEAIALLLLVTVAATVAARLIGAYDQARIVRTFDQSIDLVQVVRFAGEQVGFIAAGGVLVAFLLVTLGPADHLSARGVLALRSSTVLGLVVAGLSAFAGIASLGARSRGAPFGAPGTLAARSLADRLSVGVPLLLAAAVAGYVAWCAFSELGEASGPIFPDEVEGAS